MNTTLNKEITPDMKMGEIFRHLPGPKGSFQKIPIGLDVQAADFL